MNYDRSFRFVKDALNQQLISLLSISDFDHIVGADGKVNYYSGDEERFEELLARVRGNVFPDWQVLSFRQEWANQYRTAMVERAVSYEEELNDGAVEFLLSGQHRTHAWRLPESPTKG